MENLKSRKNRLKIDLSQPLPVLPLRDLVVFPQMVLPLFVGREKSIQAVEAAGQKNNRVCLLSQRKTTLEAPKAVDLYGTGTLAQVIQVLRLPDGAIRVMLEGLKRVKVARMIQSAPYFKARVEELEASSQSPENAETEALMRNATGLFESYVKLNGKMPPETMVSVLNVSDPGQLADLIAAHLQVKVADKQRVLETGAPLPRLEEVCRLLTHENEVLEMERRIQGRVRKNIEKVQKEYYLQEQMKAIQKELGQKGEGDNEAQEMKKKIEAAGMPADAKEKALNEAGRLEKMGPYSAEASVVRTYLDWLLALPWKERTKDNLDLGLAERILEEDHDGLKKAKARIVEYLAVRKLVDKLKGPILCLVGPPGVGKTSLAKSIARAMGRNFVRISLGGVRDEAEIRGHRRTYVGALPGRIIQSLRRAKSRNPVMLLDEVDKMSMDFRGDPSAALLEVLDPEQNATFADHYLDTEFDLSEVLFVTTANLLHEIPAPLRDRMEVIELPGYTEEEKMQIARRFLIPKQVKEHGLKDSDLSLGEEALRALIRDYTREAGVRQMEREIMALCRKAAKTKVEGRPALKFEPKDLHKHLGIPKFIKDDSLHVNAVGVATGLAWTETGGEVLSIEVTLMKGKGTLSLTGKLGDVMKESAQAALSYIRARASRFGLPADFHRKLDIHIHIPEGATPKDGPSAGITMATALVSALTGRAVRRDLAMTGEVTLRGRVLPIGGLKDKALAAHRLGFKTLIIPRLNQKDLEEVPSAIRSQIKFLLVSSMDQVLSLALEEHKPTLKDRRRAEQEIPKAEIWQEDTLRH